LSFKESATDLSWTGNERIILATDEEFNVLRLGIEAHKRLIC
jgi:hypothetical protein